MSLRKLSPELRFVVQKELNEVPSKIPEYLNYMREWLSTQPTFNIRTDDQYLITFLRGCKYNLEKTKKKIKTFCEINTELPEVFSGRDPLSPKIQQLLELGVCFPLPRTLNGPFKPILLIQYHNVNSREVHILDILKVITMSLDVIIKEQDSAIVLGIDTVNDLSDIAIIHMLQMTPGISKKVFKCFQEAYPVRPKRVYFLNPPSFFKPAYSLIKPFMDEKLKRKIHLYGKGELHYFHDHVPISVLPEEYGGEDGPLCEMASKWKKKIESHRQWFLDGEQLYCSQTKATDKSWIGNLWKNLF